MKKFLIRSFAFIIPVIVFYAVVYQMGYYPIISNSICYDAKILEIKRQKLKKIDIINLGSSIALYNLNSTVINDSLNRSYYNFGVWGFQIGDLNRFIKSYITLYDPKYILITSGFADFELETNSSYAANLWFPLNCTPVYYITNYVNFNDIIFRKNEIRQHTADHDSFSYLGFDKYGGIPLNITGASRKLQLTGRLNAINYLLNNFPSKLTPGAYKSLDSLASFVQSQKVKLIFIQAPFADGSIKTIDKQIAVAAHFKKCRNIVEGHGGVYLNFELVHQYPDSLFADALHLNSKGSVVFTKRVAAELKKNMNK